jgi:hypothetical protein
MTSAKRILDAVTLRRVFAALLIGGFAKEIISFLSWLADTGWDLKDVATLRALGLATLQFALEAVVIYLAVQGLSAVLGRRRRDQALAFEEAASEEHDPAVDFGVFEATGDHAAGWTQEGGGDGRGPEHY